MILTVKEKIIAFEEHAFYRMIKRCPQFGLNYYEAREQVLQTIKTGQLSIRKHISNKFNTYYHYFNNNLSFYVICQEVEYEDHIKCLIKTVIVEVGRE